MSLGYEGSFERPAWFIREEHERKKKKEEAFRATEAGRVDYYTIEGQWEFPS